MTVDLEQTQFMEQEPSDHPVVGIPLRPENLRAISWIGKQFLDPKFVEESPDIVTLLILEAALCDPQGTLKVVNAHMRTLRAEGITDFTVLMGRFRKTITSRQEYQQ
jgi:hypothetical protein